MTWTLEQRQSLHQKLAQALRGTLSDEDIRTIVKAFPILKEPVLTHPEDSVAVIQVTRILSHAFVLTNGRVEWAYGAEGYHAAWKRYGSMLKRIQRDCSYSVRFRQGNGAPIRTHSGREIELFLKETDLPAFARGELVGIGFRETAQASDYRMLTLTEQDLSLPLVLTTRLPVRFELIERAIKKAAKAGWNPRGTHTHTQLRITDRLKAFAAPRVEYLATAEAEAAYEQFKDYPTGSADGQPLSELLDGMVEGLKLGSKNRNRAPRFTLSYTKGEFTFAEFNADGIRGLVGGIILRDEGPKPYFSVHT